MPCEFFQNVIVADEQINPDAEINLVARSRCKMWKCEYCAGVNRRLHQARLMHAVNELGGSWSFNTFTASRYKRGPVRSLQNIRGAWDTLMKRAKRRWGKFQYCRVYEPHADGSWHVHAVFSVIPEPIHKPKINDPRTWYSVDFHKWCSELGIGYIINNQHIREGQPALVAGYLVKYMTKSVMTARQEEIGRMRRIQYSQGMPELPRNQPLHQWRLKAALWPEDIFNSNRQWVDVDTGEIITSDVFLESTYYPPELD